MVLPGLATETGLMQTTLEPHASNHLPEGDTTLESALRLQQPVICAIDNDDLAAGILASAAVLAAQLAVPLTVIHSPDPDILLSGEPRRTALERGNAFVDQIAQWYTLDERVVDLDDPARLVIAVAEEGASLIVIGTRGQTGLRAALLGSVSQTVIRSATCPVIVIPSAAAGAMDVTSQPASRGALHGLLSRSGAS
jgi:nucleotide-binding universal stress UspA family protein